MFYLEVDLNNPEMGLELLASDDREFERGCTYLANLAIEFYSGYNESYSESAKTVRELGAFVTSIPDKIPFDIAVEMLDGEASSSIIIEKNKRLSLVSDGVEFHPTIIDELFNADDIKSVTSSPHALELFDQHGFDAITYTIRPSDFDKHDVEDRQEEHITLGFKEGKDTFRPWVTVLNEVHPVIITRFLETTLQQK